MVKEPAEHQSLLVISGRLISGRRGVFLPLPNDPRSLEELARSLGARADGPVSAAFTVGYPSDATDVAVQANIVAVGYKQVSTGFPATRSPYTITNVNSGTDVAPAGCGTADGTGIELSSLDTTCQQWTFTSAGNGRYIITNVSSGEVLDSVDCGTRDGTLTDLWSSLGNLCQEWNVTPAGSHETISNVANGMVLTRRTAKPPMGPPFASGPSSTTPASNGTSSPDQSCGARLPGLAGLRAVGAPMTRELSSDRAGRTLTEGLQYRTTDAVASPGRVDAGDLPRREDGPDGVRVILGVPPAPASATGPGDNCVDQPQRRVRPL